MGRPCTNLALLVDNCLVILVRSGIQCEDGPTVLDGKQRGEMILHEACAELRLERVDVHLGMAVQKTVYCIAPIFVHRGKHEKTKSISAPVMRYVKRVEEQLLPFTGHLRVGLKGQPELNVDGTHSTEKI